MTIRSRALFAPFALALVAAPLLFGCENKMEPKECDKIRGEAFDLLNKAQHCNTDADCKQSAWPGCQKPLNNGTFDKIAPMKDGFVKGKCDEKPPECKEAPPVYCKQGLCVHREKAMGGDGATPVDEIKVQ